jgi:hypothetical protein
MDIRDQALALNGPVWAGEAPLTSVGMAQKLMNLYIKYRLCWQIIGEYPALVPRVPAPPGALNPRAFLCALHAPIDNIMLAQFLKLSIGKYLLERKLLRVTPDGRTEIFQSNPQPFVPWTKLDDLRSYYGLQLAFRRVAMKTWDLGCACKPIPDSLRDCVTEFDKQYPPDRGSDRDWLKEVLSINESVIQKTKEELLAWNNTRTECIDDDANENRPIYIKECARNYVGVRNDCGKDQNDALICLLHGHIWFKQNGNSPRYLLGEIIPPPNLLSPRPRNDQGRRIYDSTCVAGQGFEGGLHFETEAVAVRYLKDCGFDVRACPENGDYTQDWIDDL